jgi:putative flippase GtrA
MRYGLVVAIAAPIDLGGYIVLKSAFHVYYVLAATISFTVSLIANYLLSVAWVWTNHTGRESHIDAIIFGIIGVVGLGLTDLIVYIFTDLAHLNFIVSKLIAFIIIFFWSFGARRWLFKTKEADVIFSP